MKQKKVGNAIIHYTKNIVHAVVFLNKKGSEMARIPRDFAMTGGKMLGIECKVNGMGPSNNKVAYAVCQKLPCADDFKTASQFHDVVCSLGDAVTNRKTGDKIWYWINKLECIASKPWYLKFRYLRWNFYGWRLLVRLGKSSWNGGAK